MEAENNNKPAGRKFIVALSLLLLVFIIYYIIMAISAPVRKNNELTDKFGYKPDDKNKLDERILSDSAYLKLLKEKAFNQARIAMAETDSIYLSINLADSTTDLEISGVTVHSSHISRMNISKILRTGNEYAMTTIFSRPLTIITGFFHHKKSTPGNKNGPQRYF